MSDTLTPLLLDAKREYTSRLEEIMCPQLRATFNTLYNECVDEADQYLCFQGKMRQVPYWNSSIVAAKTQSLITAYSFFENLVVAVVVTYVKVLSAIRLGEGRPSVKLTVPRTDVFVHEVYKQCAMALYYEPWIMESRDAFEAQAVPEAIERSIRRLIPYDDILHSYLAADPPPAPEEKAGADDDDDSSESESDSESDHDDEEINVAIQQSAANHYNPHAEPHAEPHAQPHAQPHEAQPHAQPHEAQPPPPPALDAADDDDDDDDELPPACPPYPSPPVVPAAPAYVAQPQQYTPPAATHPAAPPASYPPQQPQQLFGTPAIRQSL